MWQCTVNPVILPNSVKQSYEILRILSICSNQEPGGNHTPPQLSPSVGQAAYTAGVPGGSLDVQHLIMQADARRRQRSNDNYFEDVPRSKLERQMAQVSMVRKGGPGRKG